MDHFGFCFQVLRQLEKRQRAPSSLFAFILIGSQRSEREREALEEEEDELHVHQSEQSRKTGK